MVTLQDVIARLDLQVLTNEKDFSKIIPKSGYASDMLSCVMVGAKSDGLWITLQSHMNIVGVASLVEACAIIITEDAKPDESTINKANQQGVNLLATPMSTYAVNGRLWEMDIKES
jgi:serine kinase of HPr protein (carbohydrate metabolism regulator)